MKFLEREIGKRGTKFFNGNELPGMLDYMIWPWLERYHVVPKVHSDISELLPKQDFPLMVISLILIVFYSSIFSFVFSILGCPP